MSYELELFGLIVLLYLYDSSVLLFANEGVLCATARGEWQAALGSRGFVLAGRTLCMLNPFTPHHPAVQLSWRFDPSERAAPAPDVALAPDAAPGDWARQVRSLASLKYYSLTAGVALFVLLPLGLFSALRGWVLLPAVVLIYLAIALALVRLRGLGALGEERPMRFWPFAFECIACPPFGVNLIRRRALMMRIDEPLPLAAARLLDAPGWEAFEAQCRARLDDALVQAAPDSEEARRLTLRKQWLSTLVRHDAH